MMLRKIATQFKRPTGFLGSIIGSVMIKGNRPAYDNLLKYLNIQQNDKILEIGYGPGIGIKLIAERFDTCKIVGIDFSELMFKRATKRNKSFIDKGQMNLLYGDFLDNKINTNDFDKVFCINVVYFWENLQIPFGKIKSLLKQDGIFYFYMASKEELNRLKFTREDIFNKHLIEQITEALNIAGFREIDYSYNKGYYIKAKK